MKTIPYNNEPDYSNEVYRLSDNAREIIRRRLMVLYGADNIDNNIDEIERLMGVHEAHKPAEMRERDATFDPSDRFTEEDVILITYGDFIHGKDRRPLEILRQFTEEILADTISTVHILPFYPYSSDRGFSVIDFTSVDPKLGTWRDIEDLKEDGMKLMFDGVFNHVSSQSRWFREFRNMNPDYRDYFIYFSTSNPIPDEHMQLIVRPRTTSLLTEYPTWSGTKLVWTTFSADQIDLNYRNPKLLFRILDILLLYIRKGADIVRLDAVTYIWRELGTSCVHLEQTHTIIKLFRDILNEVAPSVAIITETNVPHEENIQYFGSGTDEAQMVYNFALPPLVLHTFYSGSSDTLSEWAASLEKVSDTATYFNFLDSHDGIGVMAAKNILSKDEIEYMALRVLEHRGFISYKENGDGTRSPYELNITWYSALNRVGHESDEMQIDRFIASRAIALVLMGVPGIYIHSIFGSRNDADSVLREGQTRSINRRSFGQEEIKEALENPDSIPSRVASRTRSLLKLRRAHKAFHPNGPQQVVRISSSLFALLRTAVDESCSILAVINITESEVPFEVDLSEYLNPPQVMTEICEYRTVSLNNTILTDTLRPFQVAWYHTSYM